MNVHNMMLAIAVKRKFPLEEDLVIKVIDRLLWLRNHYELKERASPEVHRIVLADVDKILDETGALL